MKVIISGCGKIGTTILGILKYSCIISLSSSSKMSSHFNVLFPLLSTPDDLANKQKGISSYFNKLKIGNLNIYYFDYHIILLWKFQAFRILNYN